MVVNVLLTLLVLSATGFYGRGGGSNKQFSALSRIGAGIMSKIYDVWVTSYAYGDREEHCGCVRADNLEDAKLLAHDHFHDSIRTSLKDKSQELEYLYVIEWTPCEDEDGEMMPEPECVND
jgi:hypothetical protein